MKGKVYSGLQVFYIAAWKGNEKSCLDIHAFIFFSQLKWLLAIFLAMRSSVMWDFLQWDLTSASQSPNQTELML